MPEREQAGEPGRDVIWSLARGLAVIRAFDAAHPVLTLDEAASRTGFSRSATRRLLRTLMSAGYAEFDGRHFRLAAGLLDLGYAQQSILDLTDVAKPHAQTLSRSTGRTVAVARLEDNEAVFVLRVGTSRYMHVGLAVGSRLPAHMPAIGRVILANSPPDVVSAYLRSKAWRNHEGPYLRTKDELRRELASVRERGWCLVSEELDAGLQAIAAPVRDHAGRVVAGINLSSRTDGHPGGKPLEDLVPRLLESAAELSADLHHRHLA